MGSQKVPHHQRTESISILLVLAVLVVAILPAPPSQSFSAGGSSHAMMNNSGERASPCLNPLACLMFWLGAPLIRTFEDDDPSIAEIQFLHLVLKPSALSTSRRNCQPIISKAFEISNLMKSDDCFL